MKLAKHFPVPNHFGARVAYTALLSLILGLAACTNTVQDVPTEDFTTQAVSSITRSVAAGSDDGEELG